jgi:hypothetical protein
MKVKYYLHRPGLGTWWSTVLTCSRRLNGLSVKGNKTKITPFVKDVTLFIRWECFLHTIMGHVKKNKLYWTGLMVSIFYSCSLVCWFVCLFVSMGIRGKPQMYFSLAGFLYRPLWTFKLWPPDAPAPTDAFCTPAAEVGTYGRGIRTGNLA